MFLGTGNSNGLFSRPWPIRKVSTMTPKDVCEVVSSVSEMVNGRDFKESVGLNALNAEFASACDEFLRICGKRLAISRAIKSGVPLHEDGCPVRGHVASDGEKFYTAEDLLAAKSHYAGEDSEGGNVLTRNEADSLLLDLSEGQVDIRLITVAPFVEIGGTNHQISLYRERDVWNSLRAQRPKLLTMKIVDLHTLRGGHNGWAE